jgi:AcrR family transcriptional regulator
MPYPSQISTESIIATAREMIEAEGADNLSLNRLAAALGVKTPSLYRYVANRVALLRAVNEETVRGLFEALLPAVEATADQPAGVRMQAVARAYRAFAHANPATYGLNFTNTIPELRVNDMEVEQRVIALQDVMGEISGDAESLPALRGMQALIHGFVMLELAGQFQRGGDLNAAFERAVAVYIAGWEAVRDGG